MAMYNSKRKIFLISFVILTIQSGILCIDNHSESTVPNNTTTSTSTTTTTATSTSAGSSTTTTSSTIKESSSDEEEQELVQAETKDGKLEIIKRIKKINPDGSYTIGYEADDGSFKIESRDVLGNIKGTYGFVDEAGQIKRVSYSSSNASEIFTKHEPVSQPDIVFSSAVKKKPEKITTSTSTTEASIAAAPSTPESVIQSIARRRTVSSTTRKPNYNNIETFRTTTSSSRPIYSSIAPRVLLQRPSLTLPNPKSVESTAQIVRPEVTTTATTTSKSIVQEKPVTEDPEPVVEIRSNILRRQSPHPLVKEDVTSRSNGFNVQEHVFNLKQSLGQNDMPDVYNSDSTITPRPLFTTTRQTGIFKPIISSTTARTTTVTAAPLPSSSAPVLIARPTVSYAPYYHRNSIEASSSGNVQYQAPNNPPPAVTVEPHIVNSPAPSQIGENSPEILIAVKDPYRPGGTILVPLSQVHDARRQYVVPQPQPETQRSKNSVSVEIEKQNVRRLNPISPPILRPLPVQVDENGYIREMTPRPTPYPVPIPVTPTPIAYRAVPKYEIENEILDDSIDHIQPPVSTRNFQKLLNQLIMRQKQLESISILANPKTQHHQRQLLPVQFVQRPQVPQRYLVPQQTPRVHPQYEQTSVRSARQYIPINSQESIVRHVYAYRQPDEQQNENEIVPEQDYDNSQLTHNNVNQNRRAVRLLSPYKSFQNHLGLTSTYNKRENQETEEYLPPHIREMLLLRMLQLAMNPALPVENDDENETAQSDDNEESQPVATMPAPQIIGKPPIRNVEILGEEIDEESKMRKRYRGGGGGGRTKRFKDGEDMDYME